MQASDEKKRSWRSILVESRRWKRRKKSRCLGWRQVGQAEVYGSRQWRGEGLRCEEKRDLREWRGKRGEEEREDWAHDMEAMVDDYV